MKIRYVRCERCEKQIEAGEKAFDYRDTIYCPTCFERKQEEDYLNSEIVVTEDICYPAED